MTQTQFYILLGVYGVIVCLEFLVNKNPLGGGVLRTKSKVYLAWIVCAASMVMGGAGIVGYVGLFLVWHVAPWIFAFGVVGKILGSLLLLPDQEDRRSGLGYMLSECELFLDGVILTCVLFGPARHLFL